MCCLASCFFFVHAMSVVDSFGAAFCSDDNVLFKICFWNVAKFGIRHRSKWKRSVILSDFWCSYAFALEKWGFIAVTFEEGEREKGKKKVAYDGK